MSIVQFKDDPKANPSDLRGPDSYPARHTWASKNPRGGGSTSCLAKLCQQCMSDDMRPGVGVCMIAFSIPLLVPGVTLTVVAFNDETGFAKYSALHIIGMLMLIASGILLIAGILMHVKFRSKVAPDHQLSTHDKSAKELEAQASAIPTTDGGKLGSPVTANLMVEGGHTSAEGDHRAKSSSLKVSSAPDVGLRGHDNPAMTLEQQDYYTSSDELDSDDSSSFNSEEISSGSYVVLDPPDSKRHSVVSDTSKSSHDKTLLVSADGGRIRNGGPQQLQSPTQRNSFPISGPDKKTLKYFTFGSSNSSADHSESHTKPMSGSCNLPHITINNEKENETPQDVPSMKQGMTLPLFQHRQPAASKSLNPISRQRLQAMRSDTNSPQSGELTSSSASDLRDRCDSNASVFLRDDTTKRETPTEIARRPVPVQGGPSASVRWSLPAVSDGPNHTVRQSTGPLCRTTSLGQEHMSSLTVISR